MNSVEKEYRKEIVSNFCGFDCVFSCFKENCSRGSWCKPAFATKTFPQTGTDNECPMMQFEAEKLAQRTLRLDYMDTWDVCAACKYSEVDSEQVSIAKCFETHCMDCPIHELRDALQETAAEAGCSAY